MNDYLQQAIAERPQTNGRSVQRSYVRLESARNVLERAATQLARAEAALRAHPAATPEPVLPVIDAPALDTPPDDGGRAHWDRLRACVQRLTVL